MNLKNCLRLCMPVLTLAFLKSRFLPIVESSLQRHSRDSSSWFFSSFTMQSSIMEAVSIFILKSSPMNFMLPSERWRILSRASSSSTLRRSRSLSCEARHKWSPIVSFYTLFHLMCFEDTNSKKIISLTCLAAFNSFCFFSSISSSSRSFSNSSWQRLRSTLQKLTNPVLSVVGTFS